MSEIQCDMCVHELGASAWEARWCALREWLDAQRAECDAACDRLSTAAAGAFGEVLAKMNELEREEGGR